MDVTKGDIVLCELYFSDLSATKKRPVLVFKDNLPHNDFVGLPISSQVDTLHADEYEDARNTNLQDFELYAAIEHAAGQGAYIVEVVIITKTERLLYWM